MSGDDIPYQLRPNKFIDRQLFVDLLSRMVLPRGPDNYAYISMGGRHLRDHYAAYRALGIRKLFAIDYNANVVPRQLFNRPIDAAKCECMPSGNIPAVIDALESVFPNTSNVIVWLDYTAPGDRLTQFQELVAIAKKLQPGDIIRMTVNSSNGSLDGPKDQSLWKAAGASSPAEFRLTRLVEQLGAFVPTSRKTIGENDLPTVLSESIELAMAAAENENANASFLPVLLTTYKDGQRMLTATCLAVEKGQAPMVPELQAWPFMPAGWSDVTQIEAPDLSIKEKHRIDDVLSSTPQQILVALGFWLADTEERSKTAIENYQRLHRYYPSFHHIES